MKTVRLDFENGSRVVGAVWGRMGLRYASSAAVALLVSVAALALAVREAEVDATTIARLEAELARARPALASTPPRDIASVQDAKRLAQITRQLNTPWSKLLDTLESSLPEDVALVSIEPDATGKVRLQAEAKKLESLVAYSSILRRLPVFASVNLLKHETNDQDGSRPVRLLLELQIASSPQLGSSSQ
jgi:Tfp pilus assembly protein PilN